MKTTINPALAALRVEGENLSQQAQALNERRRDLHDRRLAIVEHVDAAQAAAAAARAELSQALVAGDEAGTAEARKRVTTASATSAEAQASAAEAGALHDAIASLDVQLSSMDEPMREIAERERTLKLQRMRELGGDLQARQRQALEVLAGVLANAAALNQIAHESGGPAALFSPTSLPAINAMSIGPDWIDRGRFNVEPAPMVPKARAAIEAKLYEEGFRA